jgi:hypothetical protein
MLNISVHKLDDMLPQLKFTKLIFSERKIIIIIVGHQHQQQVRPKLNWKSILYELDMP